MLFSNVSTKFIQNFQQNQLPVGGKSSSKGPQESRISEWACRSWMARGGAKYKSGRDVKLVLKITEVDTGLSLTWPAKCQSERQKGRNARETESRAAKETTLVLAQNQETWLYLNLVFFHLWLGHKHIPIFSYNQYEKFPKTFEISFVMSILDLTIAIFMPSSLIFILPN